MIKCTACFRLENLGLPFLFRPISFTVTMSLSFQSCRLIQVPQLQPHLVFYDYPVRGAIKLDDYRDAVSPLTNTCASGNLFNPLGVFYYMKFKKMSIFGIQNKKLVGVPNLKSI